MSIPVNRFQSERVDSCQSVSFSRVDSCQSVSIGKSRFLSTWVVSCQIGFFAVVRRATSSILTSRFKAEERATDSALILFLEIPLSLPKRDHLAGHCFLCFLTQFALDSI